MMGIYMSSMKTITNQCLSNKIENYKFVEKNKFVKFPILFKDEGSIKNGYSHMTTLHYWYIGLMKFWWSNGHKFRAVGADKTTHYHLGIGCWRRQILKGWVGAITVANVFVKLRSKVSSKKRRFLAKPISQWLYWYFISYLKCWKYA